MNTSYQKLPFGSGDDPDKLFSHHGSHVKKKKKKTHQDTSTKISPTKIWYFSKTVTRTNTKAPNVHAPRCTHQSTVHAPRRQRVTTRKPQNVYVDTSTKLDATMRKLPRNALTPTLTWHICAQQEIMAPPALELEPWSPHLVVVEVLSSAGIICRCWLHWF